MALANFPSELDRYDLNQIINICKGLPPGNGKGSPSERRTAAADAHRPLSIETIRRLCEERDAQLVDVPAMWPHVTVPAERAQTVAQAVTLAGLAIEHVSRPR